MKNISLTSALTVPTTTVLVNFDNVTHAFRTSRFRNNNATMDVTRIYFVSGEFIETTETIEEIENALAQVITP